MNSKAVSLLSPAITTKKLYPLLAMNPKAVSLLDPVINQEANPLLAMNPKAGLKPHTWYEVKISYLASIPASFSIQLKRNKSDVVLNNNRRLLNTEKLIFKTNSNQASNTQNLSELSLNGPVGQVYALVVNNNMLFAAVITWICGIFQITGGYLGLGYRPLIVSKEDLLGICFGETVMICLNSLVLRSAGASAVS
ncbi:hypothetical protein D0Y65_026348 [Glycine soja]|uniref:Uncharacterized protein n=1 Tax=Glycine soja TaxID=3848 RepID=A0A445IJK8_GLYSO|nr:hypothetical protein D0Y65_026348 [Glycine soja]